MSAETLANVAIEEREWERFPFRGKLSYRCALEEGGAATWCSVGREGACIRMKRYLRPGRHMILSTDAIVANGHGAELSARVVWCRPTADGGTFVAGLHIFGDDPEAALALATIVRRANGDDDRGFGN